jgi:5-methylcytosine-specific restriction protein A
VVDGSRCPAHAADGRAAADARRPSAAERGYGAAWRRRRAEFLAANPICCLCGGPATVPDHWPRTRRELVAAGVVDPDADVYLRPLCERDHNRETARAPRDRDAEGWGGTTSPTPPRPLGSGARGAYGSAGLR